MNTVHTMYFLYVITSNFFLQDTIFLLQSRPITSFAAWTDFELEHEFDTAISSEKDITSKGNVG